MYIPKRYGQSKTENCAFCGKLGLAKNRQGIIVCNEHKDSGLPEIKCVCGHYLELKEGKFGPYFNCIDCGNMNFKKGLEMLESMQQKEKPKVIKDRDNNSAVIDSGKYPGFDYGVD